jgi:hypothetical protein
MSGTRSHRRKTHRRKYRGGAWWNPFSKTEPTEVPASNGSFFGNLYKRLFGSSTATVPATNVNPEPNPRLIETNEDSAKSATGGKHRRRTRKMR